MDLPPGQLPDEPGLHGSEKKLSPFCPLPHAGHLIQNPFQLRRRKVSIDDKACLLAETLRQSFFHQGITISRGSPALPDNGVIDRLSGIFVPDDGRLSLVCDADGSDIRSLGPGLLHGLHSHAQHRGPDLPRVMLHPAGLRKILGKFLLSHAHHVSFPVK